jgi:hypothetical protein
MKDENGRAIRPGVGAMLSEFPVFPILLSTDLDASRAFYHDTLGHEISRED